MRFVKVSRRKDKQQLQQSQPVPGDIPGLALVTWSHREDTDDHDGTTIGNVYNCTQLTLENISILVV